MKLTRLIAAALAAACIFTLTSCKQEESQITANDYPVHVADTVVDHRPRKVVSLARRSPIPCSSCRWPDGWWR